MPHVCVLLANGFEEIEAVTIIDVLRRADIDVVTLSVGGSGPNGLTVQGSHGIAMEADQTLPVGTDTEWDMILLPGGLPGATNLRDHPQVQALLQKQNDRGGKVGAICAAPIALGAAGILHGKRATSYPGFEDELHGAQCVEDRVVTAGNVVTSRGVGTALEFTLAIVAQLRDEQTAATLRDQMLVRT